MTHVYPHPRTRWFQDAASNYDYLNGLNGASTSTHPHKDHKDMKGQRAPCSKPWSKPGCTSKKVGIQQDLTTPLAQTRDAGVGSKVCSESLLVTRCNCYNDTWKTKQFLPTDFNSRPNSSLLPVVEFSNVVTIRRWQS